MGELALKGVGFTLQRPDGSRFEPVMPTWFDPNRGQAQIEVAEQIADGFHQGNSVVVLQAPTGAGKTAIAEMVRQILGVNMMYVPPHIQLQRQFLKAFKKARIIMGKGNYSHGLDPGGRMWPGQTCGDCRDRDLCNPETDSCAYKDAKAAWMQAEVGVANLSYWLTVANHMRLMQCQRIGQVKGDGKGPWRVMAGKKWAGKEFLYVGNNYLIDEWDAQKRCWHCGFTRGCRVMLQRAQFGVDPGMAFDLKVCLEEDVVCRACLNLIEHEWPEEPEISEEWQKFVWDGFGWCGGRTSRGQNGHLSVFDECDVKEDALLNFFKVEFEMRWLIQLAEYMQEDVPKPPTRHTEEKWYSWFADVVKLSLGALRVAIGENAAREEKDIPADRFLKKLELFVGKLRLVKPEWIYQPHRETAETKTGKKMRIGDTWKVTIQPVMVEDVGKELLWRWPGRILDMSGTVVSSQQYALETGLEQSGLKWSFIKIGRDWDPWRGPIFRFNLDVVKRSGKSEAWTKQAVWPELMRLETKILTQYPDERHLIHSSTYELALEMVLFWSRQGMFKGRLFVHERDMDKREMDAIFEEFRVTEGGIMITPLAVRGVDLPYADCRNVHLPKILWPNLAEKRIEKRREMPGGKQWYLIKAIREVLQAIARAQRGPLDWCRIFIIDGVQFNRMMEQRRLIDRFILNAIRPEGNFIVPPAKNWALQEKKLLALQSAGDAEIARAVRMKEEREAWLRAEGLR